MNPVWLDAVVLLMDGPALCGGVIVNPTGVVATAYHCVTHGDTVRVELRDGRVLKGTVQARDPAHDLALVRIDAMGLPVLAVRAEDPTVGERVYGLGHPLGSAASGKLEGLLAWSVSEGIVSAVGPWLIQTDAALNPGNSGGPVVDAEGRVVGIVSKKLKADNIAFLAKSADLDALVRSDDPGPWWGGNWGGGLSFTTERDDVWVGANAWVSVRERLVARSWVQVGISEGASVVTVLAARQRVGTGAFSTTFDGGPGLAVGAGGAVLLADARATMGLLGVGVRWFPGEGEFGVGVDLNWPGMVGVF